MRHHALSEAAFAALAAGRPDRETLDELSRAQFGRHLLLLSAIVRAAPEETRDAYATLAAADPERVHGAVADPLTGLWAASCLAALTHRASATEPGGKTAATAGGESVQERIGKTAAEAGAERAAEAGVTRMAELAAAVSGTGPAAGRDERRLRATHGGLTVDVRLVDTDPVRTRFGLTPTGRLSDREAGRWQDHLARAWVLLVDRHRAAAEVIAAVLRVIVPVEPDPAANGISASSADAYGAVAMSVPAGATELAVGLIHEIQHSLLNAVEYLFDLRTGPEVRGYSPWRDDPRPASGVLHGAYAYLAVTRFWRTESLAGGGAVAAFEFARWRSAVDAAARHLLATGGLTPAGRRFVGAIRDEVRPWLAEPVPPDVERLAAEANADHRARWRLRNLAVDRTAVRALAGAWRAGSPRPAGPVGTRLVPAPRRALESSDRLKMVHRLLSGECSLADDGGPAAPAGSVGSNGTGTGAGTAGPVAGGDESLLRGHQGTARRAYKIRVEQRPGDDPAWAGLALVSPESALRATPEVVAAVYRALDDPAVDVEELAAWLGRAG